MGTVYVVQEVFKIEHGITKTLFNLAPARRYGEITVILPGGKVMLHPIPMVRELQKKLRKFSDDDYLLPIGDPAAIAAAGHIAAKNNGGRFKMLKWDRQEKCYDVIEIII